MHQEGNQIIPFKKLKQASFKLKKNFFFQLQARNFFFNSSQEGLQPEIPIGVCKQRSKETNEKTYSLTKGPGKEKPSRDLRQRYPPCLQWRGPSAYNAGVNRAQKE